MTTATTGGPLSADLPDTFITSKVPAATVGFWIVKLLATTVGEVGGNLMSMDFGLGYLGATLILFGVFGFLTFVQLSAKQFRPALYWATIVASTTAGTTLADLADRSLGLGYTGGSVLLLALVVISLIAWKSDVGRISADQIVTRRAELHYWITITFSQTLGTALGDWFADSAGLGYAGSTLVFGAMLAAVTLLHFRKAANPIVLFWVAFILTRPFGAVFANLFDKPIDHGGLAVSRPLLTGALIALMIVLLVVLPQEAKAKPVASPVRL